ncbi:MAG: cytidylate kinase-like family protein [Ruminococcaceae bacterium]|nr:cytidylate kinase-like family protein [Oscillospiraceae bacterium]
MAKNYAITIGRQFGSGGREIGKRLGELLGIKAYDNELLKMAADKKGIHPDYLRRVDEKANNSLLYTLAMGVSMHRAGNTGVEMPINDKLFMAQTEVIKEVAECESAIFVGRCADYILRHHPGRISFFVYADYETRVARVMQENDCPRKEAEDLIAKTDKSRVNYYNFYTGKKWGKHDNYHLAVDSSLLGVEGTAQLLAQVVRAYLEKETE